MADAFAKFTEVAVAMTPFGIVMFTAALGCSTTAVDAVGTDPVLQAAALFHVVAVLPAHVAAD